MLAEHSSSIKNQYSIYFKGTSIQVLNNVNIIKKIQEGKIYEKQNKTFHTKIEQPDYEKGAMSLKSIRTYT